MSEIIETLAEISDRYDVLLCDLWGCYHNGVAPHAGAVAALRAFRKRGGRVILLTNAPRPHDAVRAQLGKMGAPEDTFDSIVTSGDATCAAIATGTFGQRCYHLGPERDIDLLRVAGVVQVPLDEADFVLCSGLFDDETETPDDYRAFFEDVRARNLPFVCANPDVVVDRGETRIFCGGALAEAFEESGGTSHYFGKPHMPIYELALTEATRLCGSEPPRNRVLAIGDGPATDIRGAENFGLDSVFIAGGLGADWVFDEEGAVSQERLDAFLAEARVAPQKTLAFLR